MATSTGPSLDTVRTDQVGSLLRPQWLKDVLVLHGRGQASDKDLREAQDRAVREVIARQEQLGLSVLTDGELRRLNFQDSFIASVSGFGAPRETIQDYERRVAGARPLQRWEMPGYTESGERKNYTHPALEKLRLRHNQPLEEYQFASALTNRAVKVTLISPDRIVERYDPVASRPVYETTDAFLDDVVSIAREMVAQLVQAGCRYVQIDGPSYTQYVDADSLARIRARGEEPEACMRRSVEADNAIVAEFPGVTFGIHLCRGNQRSMWHREGAYDAIAERLFAGLAHRRLLLEYDTERAGGFGPLRFVPKDKVVVLGLVSTKTPELESADALKRRIEEASRYLPLEQLALSPQCGFASTVLGNVLTEDDQWRKLELVQRVAQEVWG